MPARKIKKGKRKDKEWYNILAPQIFGKAKVAETLSDDPQKIIGRTIDVSFQNLTDDLSKAHIKLLLRATSVNGLDVNTRFIGHSMTSDYMRRIIRRKQSKVEGIYDIKTTDGYRLRVKPSILTGRRIQSSQKRALRTCMGEVIFGISNKSKFDKFVKLMLDGNLGREMYASCKLVFPVKRIEICKSNVMTAPKVEVEKEEKTVIEEEPEKPPEEEPEKPPEEEPEKPPEEEPEKPPEEEPEKPPEEEPEKPPEEEPEKKAKPKKKKTSKKTTAKKK